jgi:hypothetical protein
MYILVGSAVKASCTEIGRSYRYCCICLVSPYREHDCFRCSRQWYDCQDMDSTERLIQSGDWANVPMNMTISLVSSNSGMMILLSLFCSLGLWLGDLQYLWLRSINSLLRKSFQAFKIKLMDENVYLWKAWFFFLFRRILVFYVLKI